MVNAEFSETESCLSASCTDIGAMLQANTSLESLSIKKKQEYIQNRSRGVYRTRHRKNTMRRSRLSVYITMDVFT
jgi:hypothetical protein